MSLSITRSLARPLARSLAATAAAAARPKFTPLTAFARSNSTMADQTIVYTKDAPFRKFKFSSSSYPTTILSTRQFRLTMDFISPGPLCKSLTHQQQIEQPSHLTCLSHPVSSHQDPHGHLLLRPDPSHRRGHLDRGHHCREDAPVLREPRRCPQAGRLFPLQGRQDDHFHLRHGPLCCKLNSLDIIEVIWRRFSIS